MRLGVVFPQTEISSDPEVLRAYGQTVEELGYEYILAYDHVLGANPDRPGGWTGPYTHRSQFMEPFTLFSFLAGVTQQLGFATGVLILPQRQTALVAKQAAVLDILCGGRFRLGVGIGWNEVEYTALGENFHNRGKRIEEQIEVLKALWAQELVTYQGRWHHIPDAGLNPLPERRSIPIWMGGQAEAVLRRAARLADGWMPNARTLQSAQPLLDIIYAALEQNGRQVKDFGIEARIHYNLQDAASPISAYQSWQNTATHISVNTMGCGFTDLDQHLRALAHMAAEIGLKSG